MIPATGGYLTAALLRAVCKRTTPQFNHFPYCSFTFSLPFPPTPPFLTGGLPRDGLLLSWIPTSAGPCGVANSRISPVLVGAGAGWSPSLLGLVIITIWWSSSKLILPEFSKVSKSANRSSDVCPVIRVSDIAVCHQEPLFTGLGWRWLW